MIKLRARSIPRVYLALFAQVYRLKIRSSFFVVMALRLSSCVLCHRRSHCFSTFCVKVNAFGVNMTCAMDVCGHCHEPLPGSTPESEAAEDELVEALRDIALSYVADCPEVVDVRCVDGEPDRVFEPAGVTGVFHGYFLSSTR